MGVREMLRRTEKHSDQVPVVGSERSWEQAVLLGRESCTVEGMLQLRMRMAVLACQFLQSQPAGPALMLRCFKVHWEGLTPPPSPSQGWMASLGQGEDDWTSAVGVAQGMLAAWHPKRSGSGGAPGDKMLYMEDGMLYEEEEEKEEEEEEDALFLPAVGTPTGRQGKEVGTGPEALKAVGVGALVGIALHQVWRRLGMLWGHVKPPRKVHGHPRATVQHHPEYALELQESQEARRTVDLYHRLKLSGCGGVAPTPFACTPFCSKYLANLCASRGEEVCTGGCGRNRDTATERRKAFCHPLLMMIPNQLHQTLPQGGALSGALRPGDGWSQQKIPPRRVLPRTQWLSPGSKSRTCCFCALLASHDGEQPDRRQQYQQWEVNELCGAQVVVTRDEGSDVRTICVPSLFHDAVTSPKTT